MERIVEKKFDIEPSEVVQFIRGELFIWVHTILITDEIMLPDTTVDCTNFLNHFVSFY